MGVGTMTKRVAPRAAGMVTADELGFRFYILRRRGTGAWELPGGRVDPGERRSEAALREVQEELGVGVTLVHRVAKLVFDRAGKRVPYSVYALLPTATPYIAEPDTFDALEAVCWVELEGRELAPSLAAVRDAVYADALVAA